MGTVFANASKTEAISPEQIDLVKRILDQIGAVQPGKRDALRVELNTQYMSRSLTRHRASEWICALENMRDDLRSQQARHEAELAQLEAGAVPFQRTAEPRPNVPAGRYAVENEQGVLTFYRVAVNDRGRYEVFAYASDRQHKVPGWKAAMSILRKIEAAGCEAAGMRFAQESERCRDCGRRLTDDESRARGRGEICAGLRTK